VVYAALDVPRPTDDAKARAPDGAPERGGGNGVLVERATEERAKHGGIGSEARGSPPQAAADHPTEDGEGGVGR